MPLASRRNRNGFDEERGPLEPNRPGHAKTLAGVLAGLGLPYPGPDAQAPEEEAEDSRVVLVFEGRAALSTGPFRRWNMMPLAEGPENAYLVLTDAESRRLFGELVAAYGGNPDDWRNPESWRDQLDAIRGVRLYGRQDRESSELQDLQFVQLETVDVLIWPSTLEDRRRRERVARERVGEIERLVRDAAARDAGVRILVTDPRPDTTLVRAVVDRALLDALLDHPYVERVHPPLRPTVRHADLAGVMAPASAPRPFGEAVGVIDDLVVDNPYLAGVTAERASFPAAHAYGPPTAHGTNVAGIAAYGELRPLVDGSRSIGDPHPVLSARIMEEDPHRPGKAVVANPFHTQLEEALRWLHGRGVRVAVCSINTHDPDTSALPSEATATIDRLARELGIVIVVSAGNFDPSPDHWLNDYAGYLSGPAARVADPGGAALALTVGAVAFDDIPGGRSAANAVAIAKVHQPSPFTRVGPTRGRTPTGTRKPEFVANGGNFGWDGQLGTLVQHDPALGVITLAPGGAPGGRLVSVVEGTSFAAPFVANQVARIATRYPTASANLLRALTALSATPPAPAAPVRLANGALVSAYGIPSADAVLESGTRRVILTYEGAIRANSSVIHEIPIPQEFATGHLGQQLTVALAFDPPVRRSRRSYLAGAMDFDFVRNMDLETLRATYERQPTRTELAEHPELSRRSLPSGHARPSLEPGVTALASNTTIRRRMVGGGWDPDDEGYHLVVTHSPAPWATGQKDSPDEQEYALAVELRVRDTVNIDLRSLVQARLASRARARGRV